MSQERFTQTFPDPEEELAMVKVSRRRRRVVDSDSEEDNSSFQRHPSLRRTDTQSTIPLPETPFSLLPPAAFAPPSAAALKTL